MLGFGITQLEFATGQDSYLNKDDQVYNDNVAYQDLFGGQAMLGRHHDGRGPHGRRAVHADGIARSSRAFHDDLMETGDVHGRDHAADRSLEFTDTLVQASPAATRPRSIAGTSRCRRRWRKEQPDRPRQAARLAGRRARRSSASSAIPADERTLDNPEWVDFLLYDNEGEIRTSQPSFSSTTTARRRSSSGCPATSRSRTRARPPISCDGRRPTSSSFANATVIDHRRADPARRTSTTTCAAGC